MTAEFPFHADMLLSGGDLFPSAIADDPWIAYHGTSQLNCDAIQREGFRDDVIDGELLDAACRVRRVFEEMDWAEEDLGGFAVLKPWSLRFDARGDRRFIFLLNQAIGPHCMRPKTSPGAK